MGRGLLGPHSWGGDGYFHCWCVDCPTGRESVSAWAGFGLSLLHSISVAVMTHIYSIENLPKLNTMMLLLTCDV